MKIDGFGIGGYRSFSAPQRIGPFEKLSLFAGQNNSGKSNILRFATDVYPRLLSAGLGGEVKIESLPLDTHIPTRGDAVPLSTSVAFRPGSPQRPEVQTHLENQQFKACWDQLTSRLADDGLIWFPLESIADARSLRLRIVPGWLESEEVEALGDVWKVMSNQVSNSAGGLEHNVTSVASWILRHCVDNPKVALIPAIREVGTSNKSTSSDYSGRDLVDRLAKLQNPAIADWSHKEQFDAINQFLQEVTDVRDARLEIPHDRQTINVTLNDKVLPLENLGTGIHEVTMLAAWSTILTDQLVCIEEPELHLHPLLQRKLIRYLNDQTTNQYLITTHSAHLLDHPATASFHVQHREGSSTVSPALGRSEHLDICSDLGYRASDLLQANAVIWVEGPSDRIYVRHWLQQVEPDLVEGIHYSIMFYGGRLLAHLDADDSEIDEFIALRRINQWLAVIIDSDRSKPQSHVNPTKQRISNSLKDERGLAWITKGREIENYVPIDLMTEAVAEVHPRAAGYDLKNANKYSDVTQAAWGGKLKPIDKVKVAHYVANNAADLSPLDLEQRVRELANFVMSANGANDRVG